jgi:2,4-dienoyl-CoA reductase-like NADH-dependent reductase (Old Yellow Enzyme family)
MWIPKERIKHALPTPRWPSAAEAAASRWFSPAPIGPRTAPRRTWVPAMVPWRASPEGDVTESVLAWYRAFARGKPGVLVVEATGIRDVPSGPLLRIGHDRFLPGLRRLVDAVREASDGETRLLVQVIDFLRVRRRPSRQDYLSRFLAVTERHREALLDHGVELGPGDDDLVRAALAALDEDSLHAVLDAREREELDRGARERVTDVELAHIASLPAVLPGLFADAAARAESAGFDGVELHYAHAYTMASFLSATNTRQDGYGGTLEGRLRLPREVLAAVRARVGGRIVIGLRYLADEMIEAGSGVDDAVAIGLALARDGADFLSLSRGGKFDDAAQPKVGEAVYPYTGRSGYECMPSWISDAAGPWGRNLPATARIKHALVEAGLATPVVAAGGIHSFDQAEAILARGEADFVAAARQTLADPDWFEKVRLGRGDEIRRCTYTNYCEALDQRHKEVTCKLWDRLELAAPDVMLDESGRRRLLPPTWRKNEDPRG